MATSSSTSSNPPALTLTASYTSPTNPPFTLANTLHAPASGTVNPTVPDKTRYLSELRAATTAIQGQINRELTQRMDEDNSKAASSSAAAKHGKSVDDAKEEENYGEEVQEEED